MVCFVLEDDAFAECSMVRIFARVGSLRVNARSLGLNKGLSMSANMGSLPM